MNWKKCVYFDNDPIAHTLIGAFQRSTLHENHNVCVWRGESFPFEERKLSEE